MSKLPASLLISSLFLLTIFACEKESSEIGYSLLPPSDTLNVVSTDTVTVEAFSVELDSVRTDKSASLVMGSMMDPVFGKTTMGFYTQVRLSSEGVDFGNNPVLDSLVLMLFYDGYYGDTTTKQNVKVYEISEDLIYDSVHFSNQRIGTYPTVLADQDFIPNITDSVKVLKDKLGPHLRINLSKQSNYLGNKILEAPKATLALNSTFIKFVKGLYVVASPVNHKGALLNFNIAKGNTKLVVYFHDGDDPAKDSVHYDLSISQACARFVTIDHNEYLDASQDLKRQILNHDSAQGAKQVYIQGSGGVRIKFKFPYFKDFAKGKIVAINDAILQVTNMQNDTILSPPPTLTIIRQDSANRFSGLVDENEGSGYFGGGYNKTARTYSFRITQHLQNILQNSYKTSFDLYMVVNTPSKSSVSPNRVMFYGTNPTVLGGNNSNRFKLKITYTVLN